MNWFRVVVLSGLTLLLTVLFATTHAETLVEDSQYNADASDTPIFFISRVWPWGYAEASGRPQGMLADFARRLAEVSGVPLQIQLRPHRRVIAEVRDGKSGFLMLFEADLPPDAAIDLGRVTTTEILLVNDAQKTDRPLSLDSLSGKSIAFINGTSYGSGFDDEPEVQRVPVRDVFQAVELLKMGRVDGFICTSQAVYHTLGALALSASDFNISRTDRRRHAHLYMDRKAPWGDEADKLQAGLETMREDGDLDRIFALPKPVR